VIDPRFVILAAAINLAGISFYVRDTVAGRNQPNRVTWLLWGLAPLIIFAAQLGAEAGLSSLMTLVSGVGPLLVVAASFVNPAAYWAVTRRDLVCAALAALALVGWLVTRQGAVAIALSILADFAAGWPTLTKAYHRPETESATAFAGTAVAAAITLASIEEYSFATVAFPLFLLCVSSVLVLLVAVPRRTRPPVTTAP
jgi:hypothetical protein